MKQILPGNAKIAKDAKESVQTCVSEFISFITSEATDRCQRDRRKTIDGDDLLWAMGTLGFDEYIPTLRVYLARFRESQKQSGGNKAAAPAAAGGGGAAGGS
jgi:nuclear transcription Y subunit beta